MSTHDDKELSLLTSSTLDNFGFSLKQIKLRSEWIEKINTTYYEKIERANGRTFIVSVVGSSGEGVQVSGSDYDMLCTISDAICVDEGFENKEFIILGTDYSDTAPGYTKVVSISSPVTLSNSAIFRSSSIFDLQTKKVFISSEKVKRFRSNIWKIWLNMTDDYRVETNGPAFTFTNAKYIGCDADEVFSIYFYGGNYLRKWADRPRLYTWPSHETITEISEMEGYIVPIGDKQSDLQALEWRICYTTAEKKLVSGLTDTQIKAYVLLKIMAKSLLKPECKFLTSYIIKNVIFWVLEMSPCHQLTPSHLINLVQTSLYFMKHCIVNNHLPNYMIPERNLLKGEVYGKGKERIVNFLTECLAEGGSIILKIPKLYFCISLKPSKPELVLVYSKWRNEVELCVLECRKSMSEQIDINAIALTHNMNEMFLKCMMNCPAIKHQRRMTDLVTPDAMSLILSGITNDDLVRLNNERLSLVKIL